nr:tripartite tricarboxylate transporter permease [Halomonas tianxiuensis]
MFESLLNALPVALQLGSLISLFVGTLIGILIGALPGLNPVMAIALMLPLTYGFDPSLPWGWWPESTTAPCTAAPFPPSCSTFPARPPPSPPPSTATR